MKKCPFCKADIEENARFCLYCMTPLEEKQVVKSPIDKNKRWRIVVSAVLMFVAVITCIWYGLDKEKNNKTNGNTSAETQTSFETQTSSEPEFTLSNQDKSTVTDDSSQGAVSTIDEQTSTTGDASSPQNTSQSSSQNNSNNSTGTSTNTNTNTNTNAGTNDSSPTNAAASSDDKTNSTAAGYSHVEATVENVYPPGYGIMKAPENAIVITKVNCQEESGIYVIPDTIDGKKVSAIMPSAFCDAFICHTVKSVILPSSVRTIWSDAFKDCYNLKDIYIKSSVIGIYTDAFPETAKRAGSLTIHCAKDCRDFDFYYYRNIADDYDALYEEWNG